MKLVNLTVASAAILALASCSNEDTPFSNETGTLSDAYTRMNISLNSDGTRAPAGFDKGSESEWSVANGKILVFENGATENAAKFVCAAELSGMTWSNGADGEITTSSNATAHLSDINLSDASVQYSALVVLNYNADFIFPAAGDTFGSWSQKAQTNSMTLTAGDKTYITMSQAPKFTSSTTTPSILVPLDKSAIAPSEASLSTSAASFTVERGVAKVMLSTKDSYNVTGSNYQGDIVKVTAWNLDITNRSTFPVQVTDGLLADYPDIWSKARFSGAENSMFRRIFWAKDPNYNLDLASIAAVNAQFYTIGNEALTANPAFAYCLENTFDINHQLQGQTTRVVVKAKYRPAGIAEGETFFKVGSSSQLWTSNALKEEIKARAITATNSSDITVELGEVATKAGNYALSNISIKKGGADIDAAARENVAKALGLKSAADTGIAAYINGDCYYVVRVKHFGNEETPWLIGEPTYAGNNEKYLGRYGIVRNTIYSVVVNSISNPGAPSVPAIDPTLPDDVNDYFIEAKVSILSWSKRVNNEDL